MTTPECDDSSINNCSVIGNETIHVSMVITFKGIERIRSIALILPSFPLIVNSALKGGGGGRWVRSKKYPNNRGIPTDILNRIKCMH